MFTAKTDDTFTLASGYELRVAGYKNGAFKEFCVSTWGSSFTISQNWGNKYDQYRINVRNSNNINAIIQPTEITYTTTISDLIAYVPVASKTYVDNVQNSLETTATVLNTAIGNTENNLKNITTDASIETEQGAISAIDGVEADSEFRIRTGFVKFSNYPVTITAASGYLFRVFVYNNDFNYNISSPGDWKTSYTINNDNNNLSRRFVIRYNTDNTRIYPSDFSTAISSGFANAYCVIPSKMLLERIKENDSSVEAITNQFNLNEHMVGLHDMCWEYQNWNFPQVLSYTGIRDQLYFTFTTGSGYSGIAQYNYDTKEITKTILKRNNETDDHNLISVLILPDRRLLCAYSDGHNKGRHMYIRKSKIAESIDWFDDVIALDSAGTTTYAQLFYYDSKVYLFYRVNNMGWSYRISSDDGETWGDESQFITANIQYYTQLTETTTSGVLRLCCYSNPSQNATDIRTALLHLDNMTIYEEDDSTVISAAPFAYTDVPVLIAQPGNGVVNRLYNALKTSKNDIKVLFAQFTMDDPSNAMYKIYDNGIIQDIVIAGLNYWPPKAQNGIAWVGTNKIVVARGYQGSDLIELYDYNNGMITLNKTIATVDRGTFKLRTCKPMVDNNARSVIYVTGYYNSSTFLDFNMDGVIYNLQE